MPRSPKKSTPQRGKRGEETQAEIAGVRIIGGSLRGRRLEYSGDIRTRPMKDRVRESVFNLVGTAANGARAIDLFAGTGALGLEAISRGASRATFIERHYPTSQLLKQNAATLGVGQQCEVIFGDAFLWAKKWTSSQVANSNSPSPWLVFCSPPFDFFVSRQAEMLELISSLWGAAPVASLFVVESDERFDFSLLPESGIWDVREYPPAKVGLATKNSP